MRELAERKGAALKLSDRARGTEVTIELQRADPADGQQLFEARRCNDRYGADASDDHWWYPPEESYAPPEDFLLEFRGRLAG